MSQPSEHNSGSNKYVAKGTEVFIGGLPRTATDDKIRQVFSSCGEIVDIRLLKDHKGILKGFGFVRFATKEAANRAISEKSGTMIDGKKIGVLPSTEQNTLYFGNLNKAWGADEFEQIVLQVFSDVESVELVMLKDVQPGHKQKNRGFAFVKFSTHAAASRAQRVASQPDFRLGNLHPAVQWAEEAPEADPQELSEIKVAFVRSLPSDVDEDFLKKLFEPFGKVEKVVVSKKGSFPVGFVHFYERSELDKSIKALNDKPIRGPSGGPVHKLQVEVARPMDKTKKRARDNVESNLSVQGESKYLKEQPSVLPVTSRRSLVQLHGIESADPYEDAVVALPLAAKERLLRILRLGIATRYDIDVNTLRCLKELPESVAISVLDQFMLSGASAQNKGVYLAELISRYLADKLGLGQSLTSFSRAPEHGTANDPEPFSYSPRVSPGALASVASHARSALSRPEMYPLHNVTSIPDYSLASRAPIGRFDQQLDYLRPNRALSGSQMLMGRQEQNVPDYLLPNRTLSGQRILSDRVEDGSDFLMHRMGRVEESYRSPLEPTSGSSYGRAALRVEELYVPPRDGLPSSSYARHGINLSSDATAVADRQGAPRPQMRFDPYTGEPYKFDPFTGEPIRPESGPRQF